MIEELLSHKGRHMRRLEHLLGLRGLHGGVLALALDAAADFATPIPHGVEFETNRPGHRSPGEPEGEHFEDLRREVLEERFATPERPPYFACMNSAMKSVNHFNHTLTLIRASRVKMRIESFHVQARGPPETTPSTSRRAEEALWIHPMREDSLATPPARPTYQARRPNVRP